MLRTEQTILNVIQTRTGIVLKDTRLQRVEDWLKNQLATSINPTQLINEIADGSLSSPLWQQIIGQITVGETYFFRNSAHFSALRNKIFPELIRKRLQENKKYLRIWNAGCATGEEPYSIAILLRELIPDIETWSIFILATDVNEAFLAFAREGVYRERAFRNETPDYVQNRWFKGVAQGYEVAPTIRNMVTFAPLNLIESAYPSLKNNTSAVDLIMCRNVTIYFDKPTTQAVVNRFYESLATDGWLLVGHSEPQPKVYDAFKSINIDGAIFYSKAQSQQLVISSTKMVPLPHSQPQAPVSVKKQQNSEVAVPVEPIKESLVFDELAAAKLAADREEWQKALELLAFLESKDQFNPLLHYIRGLVLSHTGDVPKAIHAIKQAIYCAPKFALAHYALGDLYSRQGEKKEAVACWKRAKKAASQFPTNEIILGSDDLTGEMLQDLIAFRLGQ